MKNKYIFAYKFKGKFHPERLIDDWENHLTSIEYGDVVEGQYQIWEYPSGKIYILKADRRLDIKDYYSVPTSGLWKPVLETIKEDKESVDAAYMRLTTDSNKKLSIVDRVKKFFNN